MRFKGQRVRVTSHGPGPARGTRSVMHRGGKEEDAAAEEGCGNHPGPTPGNLRLLNDRRRGLPSRAGEDVSVSAFRQCSGAATSRDGRSRPPKAAPCE